LHGGTYEEAGVTRSVLAYVRSDGEQRFLVALNLTGHAAELPELVRRLRGTLEESTLDASRGAPFDGRATLAANEGLVIRLAWA
jgi:hypothetical protein